MPLDALAKKQISRFVMEYLQKKVPNFQKNGNVFTCPLCKEIKAHLNSATSNKLHCYKCGELGDIFNLCRKIDFPGQEDLTDEDIAEYLCEELNIKTDTKVNDWLEKYQKWGWSLVPVAANSKAASIETGWQNKVHKEISEWRDWLSSGLNVGLNGGEVSNVTLIDLDTKETPEELKKFMGETLTQTTTKGHHLVYQYDPELQSIDFRDTPCNLPIEIRANGGFQTVIYPSVVDGKERTWNDKEPIKMPDELKQWLLARIVKTEEPVEEVNNNPQVNESDFTFDKLSGNRNNTFLQFGGILAKYFGVKDIEKIMALVNNGFIDKPLPQKEIKAMIRQLGKYVSADTQVLTKKILEYLHKHDEASARDLVECLKMERKDIQEVLGQLIQDNKVYKQKSMYKAIQKPNWKTEFFSESKVLDFEVPFFSPYATFRKGDMICLGAATGIGKSYLALNFIKKYVEQGIHPHYISSEPGNRFATIAMKLGLKEGNFSFCNHYNPQKLELEDNAVTVIDWILPEDYAGVDKLYKIFAQQLDAHGGLLYIFSQLKDNGDFYSKDMIKFFAAFAVKYFYSTTNGVTDNQKTYFKTEKIREAKTNSQYVVIPTQFNNPYLELRKG